MRSDDDNNQQSVEVANPVLGSLKIRGTDWVPIITLIMMVGIAFAMYVFATDAKLQVIKSDAQAQSFVSVLKELAEAQKEGSKQQRLLTCIVSRPDIERKREFESPNSFCQQVSRP